jgi:hypothetical protein
MMTEDFLADLNLSQLLVAILEEVGTVEIPTTKFMNASFENKEIVVNYDDEIPSFTFSLRDKAENGGV